MEEWEVGGGLGKEISGTDNRPAADQAIHRHGDQPGRLGLDIEGHHIDLVGLGPLQGLELAGQQFGLHVMPGPQQHALPDQLWRAIEKNESNRRRKLADAVPIRTFERRTRHNAPLQGMIATLGQKDVIDAMLSQGTVPTPSTPEEFTAYMKSELQKWGAVVKMADIKAE